MPQIPVIVLVLVIFALVVLASAKKVHLGLAAAVGGVVFALIRGQSLPVVAGHMAAELLLPDTWLLMLLLVSIMVFSAAMKKAGAMSLFSRALAALVSSPRFALALAPMIIGTLPMPGGAVLSAPLVDAFDPKRTRSGAVLATTNYWFRHVLELFWPLYPAFILTSTLSGFSVGKLMLLNLYALPVLFALGLIFVLPRLKNEPKVQPAVGVSAEPAKPGCTGTSGPGKLGLVLEGFAPLVMVLGIYALVDGIWQQMSGAIALPPVYKALVNRYAGIFSGLVCASLYVAVRYGWSAFRGSLTVSTLKLAGVVAGIRLFSALLQSAGVAEASAAELAAAGIPALAATALLPFVAGLVTGVGFGYVGLSFPIILGLFPAGSGFPPEAVVVLAGAFGYVGMMLSPLHVCMVVSASHFGTGLLSVLRRFAMPMGIFLLVGIAYASLVARLF